MGRSSTTRSRRSPNRATVGRRWRSPTTDGSVTVADDGRGLPVDTDPGTGKNGIVKTLGTARAGGKFSAHTDATTTGAGLNGIGAAAAVFISSRTDVTVTRDGKTYVQSFGHGCREPSAGRGSPPVPSSPATTPSGCAEEPTAPPTRTEHRCILFDPTVAPDCSLDIAEVLLRAQAAVHVPGCAPARGRRGLAARIGAGDVDRTVRRTLGNRRAAGADVQRGGDLRPEISLAVEGSGSYTTGRGPTPMRWSVAAGPPNRPPSPRSATPFGPPTADRTCLLRSRASPRRWPTKASRMRDLGLAKGEDGPGPRTSRRSPRWRWTPAHRMCPGTPRPRPRCRRGR